MKKIDKEELFGHLRDFLKSKGVELQEGDYARRVRLGTDLLTDSINAGQDAFGRAKEAVGEGLDQLRQAIHERTAPPKSSPDGHESASSPSPSANAKRAASASSTKPPPRAKQKPRAKRK